MTTGRRLVEFAFVWLVGGAVWLLARLLWPYLELVAPVGALVVLLLAINIADAAWFSIRHYSRVAFGRAAHERHEVGAARRRTHSRSEAAGLTTAR